MCAGGDSAESHENDKAGANGGQNRTVALTVSEQPKRKHECQCVVRCMAGWKGTGTGEKVW